MADRWCPTGSNSWTKVVHQNSPRGWLDWPPGLLLGLPRLLDDCAPSKQPLCRRGGALPVSPPMGVRRVHGWPWAHYRKHHIEGSQVRRGRKQFAGRGASVLIWGIECSLVVGWMSSHLYRLEREEWHVSSLSLHGIESKGWGRWTSPSTRRRYRLAVAEASFRPDVAAIQDPPRRSNATIRPPRLPGHEPNGNPAVLPWLIGCWYAGQVACVPATNCVLTTMSRSDHTPAIINTI